MNGILQDTTPKLVITIPDTCPLTSVVDIELTMAHKCEKTIYGIADVTIDTEANTVTYAFSEAQTIRFDSVLKKGDPSLLFTRGIFDYDICRCQDGFNGQILY